MHVYEVLTMLVNLDMTTQLDWNIQKL